jgi:hypothetical protein
MGWSEADPATLAGRIVEFELERERRRELISYADYRASAAARSPGSPASTRPWWAFWKR